VVDGHHVGSGVAAEDQEGQRRLRNQGTPDSSST
jgi:hypothetical protein